MENNETVVARFEQTLPAEVETCMLRVKQIHDIAIALPRIESDEQYAETGKLGAEIKSVMARIKDLFAPVKRAAHDAHKRVCDQEATLLDPLKKSEAAVKQALGKYAAEKEATRRAAEEEARRIAHEEAERKLAEARAAEKSGDVEAAETALLDAVIADTAANNAVVTGVTPQAKGVTVTKDWEIVEIKAPLVPVAVGGVVIRPVDEAAIKRLIRESKGAVKIPGVTYRETTKTILRRS